jgi:hypothetical protein
MSLSRGLVEAFSQHPSVGKHHVWESDNATSSGKNGSCSCPFPVIHGACSSCFEQTTCKDGRCCGDGLNCRATTPTLCPPFLLVLKRSGSPLMSH